MTKLYVIVKFITFPGALVRGFWEHLVCRACGIPVEDNRLIRRDELSSHIEHELFPKANGAFAICFIPAFLNGTLAFLLLIPSALSLFYFEMSGALMIAVNAVAYWFAFSLYVNSYPLVEDALNMKQKIYKEGSVFQRIVYAPGFLGCYVGAYAEKYCVTFLLAVVGLVMMIMV